MASKKPTALAKKRSSKGKKPALGRTKIYVALLLFILLCAGLFYLALDNKKPNLAEQPKQQKTEQIKAVNVSEKIKKEQKNVREVIKFDKDENLSKIFLDPKSIDETHALSQKTKTQKEQTIKKLPDSKVLDIKPETNTTKAQDINTEINQSKTYMPTELDIIFNDKLETDDWRKISIKPEENLTKPIAQPEKKPLNQEIQIKEKTEKQIPKTKNQTKNTKFSEYKTKKQTGSKYLNTGKPKLAIVIDDVATHAHVNMMLSTGLKMTPSIFPVSKNYPDTKEIAKKFGYFMIHLPMQAQNSSNQEPETLLVNESSQSIEKKIRKIRTDFPKAKFINNHTGSKFTSNFNAINKTFEILQNQGFIFMDSKTIASSKVELVAKNHKVPYFCRDVFLDDADSISKIRKQLELAVHIAKTNGVAIAIGHPRKNTIAVLKSANELLKDVELIYINEAYELLK
ncbi:MULTISPECIES: divergent polysaccharide deacetylase family protein [unclassified Campylobacter]|uniref:divergent polysaccharide deacetylase family protein n=1 Tax=unclassified Campylobacter TaxID=2593542 RepID=UPI003D342476